MSEKEFERVKWVVRKEKKGFKNHFLWFKWSN